MRDTAKLAFKLFIICFVAAAALGAVYSVTKQPIEDQTKKASDEANQQVMVDADTFETLADASALAQESWFDADKYASVTELIDCKKNGESIGTIVKATPKGYGGTIELTVGINKDQTLSGVAIGTNSETPGLGARITESAFLDQFAGKNVSVTLNVSKNASADSDVQAITGATISSRAVTNAVNMAAELVASMPENQ